MRIILLAGGSGGHISPALAVASEIKRLSPSAECVFVCSRNRLDTDIFSKTGEKYVPIFSGKWRRYFSWKNFIDPFFLLLGFFQSLFLFLRNRPDVIFSKGGFVALPPAFAAFFLRIPLIIHESDAVSGISNRIIQKFAKKVLTTFPVSQGECVGSPLKFQILSADPKKGKKFLAFSDSRKPIVFGFGGSQGSEFLNKYFAQVSKSLIHFANFVWIIGKENSDIFPSNKNTRVYPYLYDEFADVLAASDLVIARSGSNSIFEIAVLEKPMILIPLSSAAGNHQEENAKLFARFNAAEVILEKKISGEILKKKILEILQNPQKQKEMSKAAKKLVRFDAAEKIAKKILDAAKKN